MNTIIFCTTLFNIFIYINIYIYICITINKYTILQLYKQHQ